MKVQMDLTVEENNWLKEKAKVLKLKTKGAVVQKLIADVMQQMKESVEVK